MSPKTHKIAAFAKAVGEKIQDGNIGREVNKFFQNQPSRRSQKIQKLLNDSLWDIVRTPISQRSLVIVATIIPILLLVTYVFFFQALLEVGLISAVFMAITGQFLSLSVRRITSLPDEYLDERQLAIRDKSFRIAHRGLTKTALALTFVALAAGITWRLGVLDRIQSQVDAFTSAENGSGLYHETFVQAAVAHGWINLHHALTWGPGCLLLLALALWCAWASPLAVIAWQESERGGGRLENL